MPLVYRDTTEYHFLPERQEIVMRQLDVENEVITIDELLELHKLIKKKGFINK